MSSSKQAPFRVALYLANCVSYNGRAQKGPKTFKNKLKYSFPLFPYNPFFSTFSPFFFFNSLIFFQIYSIFVMVVLSFAITCPFEFWLFSHFPKCTHYHLFNVTQRRAYFSSLNGYKSYRHRMIMFNGKQEILMISNQYLWLLLVID